MLRTLTLLAALLGAPALAGADAFDATLDDFRRAPGTTPFLSSAYGYALFPTVGKGGLLIGGAYGEGRVYRGGTHVGDTSVAQLSIGFQLGGQAYREIIFFEDKSTFDDFKDGNFEFSAQASAVAATFGASVDADFDNGVAVFTLAKGGLMYEASIGGQKFSYED